MNRRIACVREQAGMSQEAFGAKIGVTGAAISRMEGGQREPSEPVVRAICREFGISYDWLTKGIDPMYVPEESSVVQSLYMLMHGDNEFVKRTLREFAKMPREAWIEFEAFVDRLAEKK